MHRVCDSLGILHLWSFVFGVSRRMSRLCKKFEIVPISWGTCVSCGKHYALGTGNKFSRNGIGRKIKFLWSFDISSAQGLTEKYVSLELLCDRQKWRKSSFHWSRTSNQPIYSRSIGRRWHIQAVKWNLVSNKKPSILKIKRRLSGARTEGTTEWLNE